MISHKLLHTIEKSLKLTIRKTQQIVSVPQCHPSLDPTFSFTELLFSSKTPCPTSSKCFFIYYFLCPESTSKLLFHQVNSNPLILMMFPRNVPDYLPPCLLHSLQTYCYLLCTFTLHCILIILVSNIPQKFNFFEVKDNFISHCFFQYQAPHL